MMLPSLAKAGLILPRDSAVTPSRTVVVYDDLLGLAALGVLELDRRGRIPCLKRPAFWAAAAFLKEFAAKRPSWAAREIFLSLAISSERTPIRNLAVGSLGVGFKELYENSETAPGPYWVDMLSDAGADADLDHAGADLIHDVDGGLQAGGALAVQGADSGRLGEAGDEGGARISVAPPPGRELFRHRCPPRGRGQSWTVRGVL